MTSDVSQLALVDGLATSPVAAALLAEDYRLVWVNAAYERVTGLTSSVLVGMRPYGLRSPDDEGVGAADREELLAGTRDVVVTEARLVRGDRELWFRSTVSRLPHPFGVAMFLQLVEEVT